MVQHHLINKKNISMKFKNVSLYEALTKLVHQSGQTMKEKKQQPLCTTTNYDNTTNCDFNSREATDRA